MNGGSMRWKISKRQPNELIHYGVKGMRWGVRKERETDKRGWKYGDTKNKEAKEREKQTQEKKKRIERNKRRLEHTETFIQENLQAIKDDPKIKRRMYANYDRKDVDRFLSAFDTWVNLLDEDKYTDEGVALLNDYSLELYQHVLDAMYDEEEYLQYQNLTEEERESMDMFFALKNNLTKIGDSLGFGQTVRLAYYDQPLQPGKGPLYDGFDGLSQVSPDTLSLMYIDPTGKEYFFKADEYDKLKSTVDADRKKNWDFRERSTAKEEQANAKRRKMYADEKIPVKVKKGKKVDASDIERLSKSLARGTTEGKVSAVKDYLDKNPEIEKKVQEILDKEWEKTELDKISKYKKSRGKKNRK